MERAQAKIEQVPAAGPRQDRDEQEEEGCAGSCVIRFPLNFPPKKNISKSLSMGWEGRRRAGGRSVIFWFDINGCVLREDADDD